MTIVLVEHAREFATEGRRAEQPMAAWYGDGDMKKTATKRKKNYDVASWQCSAACAAGDRLEIRSIRLGWVWAEGRHKEVFPPLCRSMIGLVAVGLLCSCWFLTAADIRLQES